MNIPLHKFSSSLPRNKDHIINSNPLEMWSKCKLNTCNQNYGDGEQICCLADSLREFYWGGGYMNLYMCIKFTELCILKGQFKK